MKFRKLTDREVMAVGIAAILLLALFSSGCSSLESTRPAFAEQATPLDTQPTPTAQTSRPAEISSLLRSAESCRGAVTFSVQATERGYRTRFTCHWDDSWETLEPDEQESSP